MKIENPVKKSTAFTLIELMVVMTIMSIVMFASYLPYAHHQKKTLLKQASREISQSLSDARNLAIHGLDTGSGNLTVWLYVASGATELAYYAYPYEQAFNITNLEEEYLLKTKKLPKGIRIDTIGSVSGEYLFIFQAISGSGSSSETVLPIRVSYQWSPDAILQKEILYYPRSYISDY